MENEIWKWKCVVFIQIVLGLQYPTNGFYLHAFLLTNQLGFPLSKSGVVP